MGQFLKTYNLSKLSKVKQKNDQNSGRGRCFKQTKLKQIDQFIVLVDETVRMKYIKMNKTFPNQGTRLFSMELERKA